MTTTTIVRSGFPLKKSSLLIAGNCSRVFYCCIVSGEQYACIQFIKCLPHKGSCFSNTEFWSIAEVLIYNREFDDDDDDDIGYQAPVCGPQVCLMAHTSTELQACHKLVDCVTITSFDKNGMGLHSPKIEKCIQRYNARFATSKWEHSASATGSCPFTSNVMVSIAKWKQWFDELS